MSVMDALSCQALFLATCFGKRYAVAAESHPHSQQVFCDTAWIASMQCGCYAKARS